MDLPDWLDWKRISEIAVLTLFIMQAIKMRIPELSQWWFSLSLATGLSFGAILYQSQEIILVREILHGLFAWAAAETGYQFLSAKKSAAFTLPSKQ